MNEQDRLEVVDLIWITHAKSPHARPHIILEPKKVEFFKCYMNTYTGWIVTVALPNGMYEHYLVVDLRGGCVDDDWHVELIHANYIVR